MRTAMAHQLDLDEIEAGLGIAVLLYNSPDAFELVGKLLAGSSHVLGLEVRPRAPVAGMSLGLDIEADESTRSKQLVELTDCRGEIFDERLVDVQPGNSQV